MNAGQIGRPLPLRTLQIVAAVLLGLHAVLVFGMEPQYDEAYYWIWGQYPDLSYFDHPPLNAWLLGLSSKLFGWTVFALRLPGWLALGASLWLFALWSKRLAGDDWRRWFWTTLVIYLSSPVIGYFTALMYPDYLLFPLCLGTAYGFSVFMGGWDRGEPRYRYLFIAAVCLGLAGLTKYNAIFLALALPLYLLARKDRRALFGDWRLYAAGLVTLIIASPVLVWNVQHGFASFRFHFMDRHDGGTGGSIEGLKYFLLLALLIVSPLLFGPFVRLLFDRWNGAFADASHGIARFTFLASTVAYGAMSIFTGILPYWNVVAYLPAFALMPRYVRAGWHISLHALYGFLIVGALTLHYAVVPVSALLEGRATDGNFGWQEVAVAVREVQRTTGADLVAADSIAGAAQLGFAMGRRDVMPVNAQINQYRYWFEPADHLGESAVILSDGRLDDHAAARFDDVTLIREIEIVRFGLVVDSYSLWLGREFGG